MHDHRHRVAKLLTLSVAILACSEGDPSTVATASRFEVRDSAGVELIWNPSPRFGSESPIELPVEPSLRIGSVDGRDAFGWISGATRLSDGRILVFDGQTHRIHVFDATGEPIGGWGRDGQGPGEFAGPARPLRLPGDTVVVLDRRAMRTTVFSSEGAVIRTVPLTFEFSLPPRHMLRQSCCVDVAVLNGLESIWRYPEVWPIDGSGDRTTMTTVLKGSPSGLDTIGVFSSGFANDWPNGTNPVVREQYSPEALFATHSGRLLMARSTSLGWDEIDPSSGAPLRHVRAEFARIPVTDSIREASMPRTAEMTPDLVRRFENRPFADSVAAFHDLLVSEGGEVWLRSGLPGDVARSRYQVFAPNGEWLGEAVFPGSIWLMDVGSDYALGRRVGDLDEHYLELWRFDRLRTGAGG